MTENHCDCTVFCGDDPWLKDGRSQPCDSLKRHEAEKSELTGSYWSQVSAEMERRVYVSAHHKRMERVERMKKEHPA